MKKNVNNIHWLKFFANDKWLPYYHQNFKHYIKTITISNIYDAQAKLFSCHLKPEYIERS